MKETTTENKIGKPADASKNRPPRRRGLVGEFLEYLSENKKWFLIPILIVFLLLAALVAISIITGGAASPFIYTLF